MGRDVTGFRIDKKSNIVNDKSNGAICVSSKSLPGKSGKMDCGTMDHDANTRLSDECNEKQYVLGVKSTNHQPEEKIIKAEAHKSTGAEDNDSSVKVLAKCSDVLSPVPANKPQQKMAQYIQPNSHLLSRKQLQPHCKNYYDEEDNWSLASSTATSVRTRITVPVAPKFTCDDRIQRRKEYYSKLEEKHKALEKEKHEYEARTKEEQQAAIKQLRKSMAYKANPVPSFYREGPPPKVELKKLPVTRAISPNLTRRKSCGDTVKSSLENKGLCGRATRQSTGSYREGKASPLQKKASPITPKSKDQSAVPKSNGSNKVKNRPHQSKEMSEKSHAKEQGNEDTAIES